MNWVEYLKENPHITMADIAERAEGKALEIVSTEDLEPQIDHLYLKGRDSGFSTGWVSIDTHYRIAPKYWTLITGWPNMGKSSFVDNLAVNTMVRHNWKWLFFSAENLPYESHWAGLAELYIGRPFNLNAISRMTETERDQAKSFLRERCWHIQPDDRMTVKRILAVAQDAIKRHSINCLVIDPWNELDHSRPIGMNETEYVSHALSQIRRFARETGIHIFKVAHPAKLGRDKDGKLPIPTPHDASGSSHFWNKSDYALCVWRDFTDQTGETHVYVQKARHRWVSKLGKVALFHDAQTNRYHEDSYAVRSRYREPGDDDH